MTGWPSEIYHFFHWRRCSDRLSPRYNEKERLRLEALLCPLVSTGPADPSSALREAAQAADSQFALTLKDYQDTIAELREEQNTLIATNRRLKAVLSQMEAEETCKDMRIAQIESELAAVRLKYTMDVAGG